MPRKRTGTLEQRDGEWFAKFTVDGGKRKRVRLGKTSEMSEARARDRLAVVMARVKKDDLTASTKGKTPTDATTVEQWGTDWTSGALFARHGGINKLKVKKSADDDRKRLTKYAYTVIGSMRVVDVTDADIDRVMAGVAHDRRAATKQKVYLVLRRLFDLAIMPGRLRKDNPVTPYHKPGKDADKLFAYLFPAEFLALLKCPAVPVDRKVLYCLGCYTGLRKGSLFGLHWPDVDFANSVLTVRKTKTGVPLLFEIPSGLLWVLRRWRDVIGGKDGPVVVKRVKRHIEAMVLRADLLSAGVTRDVLHAKHAVIEPLRFHDLRATFVTWAKRAGKGDGWISDRTGHLSPGMIERYSRAARTLADLRIEPFPELDGSVPELRESGAEKIDTKKKAKP